MQAKKRNVRLADKWDLILVLITGLVCLQELESTINEALDWLDETPDADLEDLEDKKKEVEQIANPIMKDLYQQVPQGGPEEDFDFGDDEL